MPDTTTLHIDSDTVAKATPAAKQTTSVVAQPVEGELLAWTPRTDDVVTLALMASAFALALVAVRSWGFVVRTMSDFFYDIRPRRITPGAEADIEDVGDSRWLHLHVCFLVSLAYICYRYVSNPDTFVHGAPYRLLFEGVGLTLAWYVLRAVLYRFIDSVFFERWQHLLWTQVRTQCTFLSCLFLLPLLLVQIYFAPPAFFYIGVVLFYIVVSRLALFMKCYSTFFIYPGGFIHLLLYFCTLEIAPLAALWRLLEAAG
ncbi:MAG: DUF4271 domain-containing protein [Bacteroidaceae bacterium]|nr:DUF4271 domain-containing protein [Bacteroidaceae bacterium]